MNIYVAHSSKLDFEDGLYSPIRNSALDQEHTFVLPHEHSDEPFNSKEYLQDHCDLVIAEVSHASTGTGIELGWADMYEVPIICIHKADSEPSSSLQVVSDSIRSYQDTEDLINILTESIEAE